MTTVSDDIEEAAGEGSLPPEPPPADPSRRGARRAESLTPAALTALASVTQRVRKSGQFAAKGAALLDKPGSLIHAQPPTFRQAMDRHHECAGHIRTWTPLRAGRYAWGWFHLLFILPPLYLLAWVTESPLRLFIAAALAAAIWIWS